MTDGRQPMIIDPLDLHDDANAAPDDDALADVPAHERRPERAVGAGLTSAGGTAVDHGTDALPASEVGRRTPASVDRPGDPDVNEVEGSEPDGGLGVAFKPHSG